MTTTEFVLDDRLLRDVSTNLDKLERREVDDATLRHAAVAIVITEDRERDCASVLLTLRPRSIKRHANQYALPGGRLEPGETVQQAALRELDEELGVTLAADAVIGLLDDFPTRSGFRITPVVVWGGAHLELKPDPNEVEVALHISLRELNSADIPHLTPVKDSEHPVLSAPIESLGHHIYAPTAALLYQFREVALRGQMTRVFHYEQPMFARK